MSQEDLQRQDVLMIGALSAKIDALAEDVREVKSSVKWQNGRVRTLENWRWVILGAWGACCTMIYVIWNVTQAYIESMDQIQRAFHG